MFGLMQVKISELQGKVVGVYFSANWYPPCQKFNQLLVNAYEHFKLTNHHNRNPGFEVVFVSSDEDLDAFNNFRAGMPWLAIPFSDLNTKKTLNRMFDVEGIPCLVILQPDSSYKGRDGHGNGNGEGVIHEGVDILHRYGIQAIPFTKDRLLELQEIEREKHENQTLTNLLTTQNRDFLLSQSAPQPVPVASLKGKTVGLYFSAQWCLPGVKFTTKLIPVYQNIKQVIAEKGNQDEDFEIVFVSTDRDQSSFDSFFQTMPWLALPFDDMSVKSLTKHFNIQWIPSLIILGPDGKTVTTEGRNLINLYRDNAYPFTEVRTTFLEHQMDEAAKCLPKWQSHARHRHELMLVSEGSGGGAYICCDCDEQGLGWAYQCIECGYEVHPKCIKPVTAADRTV
ncbi:OLC1v1018341C1 [Oldenlandia corymbosa var. corymbosa]|uniref:protein-disulfide reductase n=1 Tax=Oldenlandia corymbosa var. corymbosa TaxID=529605 RepID=A0AAV1EBG7_OLDCO|nr:OLC1v1018341C1 [Oldenlandia corymbosa var. corymbosa]